MAMKRSRKIALIVVGALAVVVAVSVVVQKQKAGVVAVQTGDVKRQDLTTVGSAACAASRAGVASLESPVEACPAHLKPWQAEPRRNRADFDRATLNWDRAQ